MGSIAIIKPLSTVLSSAVKKSQKYQEKNSWEHRESTPGQLGKKQVCYLCAMQPPVFAKSVYVMLVLPQAEGTRMFCQLTGSATAVSSTASSSTQLFHQQQGCEMNTPPQALGHGKHSSRHSGYVRLS